MKKKQLLKNNVADQKCKNCTSRAVLTIDDSPYCQSCANYVLSRRKTMGCVKQVLVYFKSIRNQGHASQLSLR
jgi:hypothetical protein